MASQGVNVLRYSALLGGLFYGVWHQSSLNTQAKEAEKQREYHHKESLIQKAKAEWARKTAPPVETKSGLITDPNDPKFDLEAFLLAKAAEK
ncbi:ATP synthase E chain-domain-containing protein [Talaromyces proteolyticus]|uniref:ATP synthase F(0) complex subunit e, mitochondrial n=1 Tax=Talaromyces proteolyticus TaxID=1131652 RepID=A0AAD4Q355_9EURO|nr:ATP synthase E chain-domain-containing protein [Talaromyces proteolyticus]KAH8701076.1 ATP synthase E chain-domain-containing protein [Talaromyces proteolyticus]